MLKRLNELNVVIGIFFLLLAAILLIGAWVSPALSHPANIRSGLIFGVFGVVMLFIKGGFTDES